MHYKLQSILLIPPAVSYAYIEPDAQHPGKFTSTSIALGKKKSTDPENTVEGNTRFPASSLSKVVFAYLVLQVAKDKKIDFDLDTPLLTAGQEYERFEKVNGKYHVKAEQLTARDVLSHTTGLPNFVGSQLSPTLKFDESPLLAQSLEVLQNLQKQGKYAIQSKDISRTHRAMAFT